MMHTSGARAVPFSPGAFQTACGAATHAGVLLTLLLGSPVAAAAAAAPPPPPMPPPRAQASCTVAQDSGLAVAVRSVRLRGFGLQTTEVAVRVVGPRPPGHVSVFLDVERGSIEPVRVEIGPDDVTTARLRSAGLGPARVRAFSPELGTGELEVDFVWPVMFLFAAFVGGAVGGAAEWAGTPTEARRSGVGGPVAAGVLLGGVAGAAYYAVGVELIRVDVGLARFNEAAVFAFAALTALASLRLRRDQDRGRR